MFRPRLPSEGVRTPVSNPAVLVLLVAMLASSAGAALGQDRVEPAKIGKPAPAFALTDLRGKEHELSDYEGRIVVLEWFNPACNYVRRGHEEGTLRIYAEELGDREVVVLAVNSTPPGTKGSGRRVNREAAAEFEMEYPILLDESGEVARAFGVKRTPEMIVIDAEGVLRYRGPIDNAPLNVPFDRDGPVVNYVEQVVDDLEAGRPVRRIRARDYGCLIPDRDGGGGGGDGDDTGRRGRGRGGNRGRGG